MILLQRILILQKKTYLIKSVLVAFFVLFSATLHCQQLLKFRHQELPPEMMSVTSNTLLQDKKGFIWMGFNNGIVLADGHQTQVIRCYENGVVSSFRHVNDLVEDCKGRIWIATMDGVFIYNRTNHQSNKIRDEYTGSSACRSIDKTSKNEILVGTENGLYFYDTAGTYISHYTHVEGNNKGLSNHIIRSSYEDINGNLWIGTFNGLNFIDRKKNEIKRFKLQRSDSILQRNNLVLSIKALDNNNDSLLVVGTETGLCLFNTYSEKFEQYTHSEELNTLSNNVIKSLCVVNNQIWIGTDYGLNVFDLNNKQSDRFFHNYLNTHSICNNIISDVLLDNQNNLWLATNMGIDRLYIPSYQTLHNQFKNSNSVLKEGINIKKHTLSSNGDVWFVTNEGVIYYNSSEDAYHKLEPPKILHNKVHDVVYDENGLVWIATSAGLNIYNPKNHKIESHTAFENKKNALTTNYLSCLSKDSEGNIWIGTFNKGVFRARRNNNGDIDFYNVNQSSNSGSSLVSNKVYDIQVDKKGNIWIGTKLGINVFNVVKGTIERFKDEKYGAVPNCFINQIYEDCNDNIWLATAKGLYFCDAKESSFSCIKSPSKLVKSVCVSDSLVYFISKNKLYRYNQQTKNLILAPGREIDMPGLNRVDVLDSNTLLIIGNEGFVCLNTKQVENHSPNPTLRFTGLFIHNQRMTAGIPYKSRVILNKDIDETESLNLKYSENTFSLEFSSLVFGSENIQYSYILDGYDQDWLMLKNGDNRAIYTQVRPGKYTFRVKAANSNGVFINSERNLSIRVKPPLYLSKVAILLYVIIFSGLFWLSRRLLVVRMQYINELEMQTMQRKRSEELIEIKSRFYTNISHELKTPLTLISSPIEELLENNLDNETKNTLQLVNRNIDRLKKLVNQILDMRKIDKGIEQLRLEEYDIVRFCKRVVEQFDDESVRRHMNLKFNSALQHLNMCFDLEKIEKVIVNLLSNAFKFTPDHGHILVDLNEDKKLSEKQELHVKITVSDTGAGIDMKDSTRIFERYNNLGTHNYSNQPGTGIGLSLVKEYVEMHNGKVLVESTINEGSKFSILLPIKVAEYSTQGITLDEINSEKPESNSEYPIDVSDKSREMESEHQVNNSSLMVLVVEDDADMRDFICLGLEKEYEVSIAKDGEQGVMKAIQILPDIIVSDVMMPNLSGTQLCAKLKADVRTSHIPIILLTAKGGIENQIKGIETGADDYIQKPFNMNYLRVRIKNLMAQRSRLREYYLNNKGMESVEIAMNPTDEKFLTDVLNKIEQEMDNSELNVSRLGELLGLSNTNLYRKIKALTGLTATEYIRNVRLKKAAQLLKNKELNVTDVMYMVGFNHRSYFTRSFKEMHGVSPKEFK
ncbi:MAG: ATP-binding protein [Bacteroidales bacterium]|nr:ATP-binding protein [Bacteroidales bacterium]